MNFTKHPRIRSQRAPSVEVDTQASAVYVRFKKTAVAKTVQEATHLMHLAIDFDAKGEVVGIEAVGMETFNIESIMKQAGVEAPKSLVARTRYVPADLAVVGALACPQCGRLKSPHESRD